MGWGGSGEVSGDRNGLWDPPPTNIRRLVALSTGVVVDAAVTPLGELEVVVGTVVSLIVVPRGTGVGSTSALPVLTTRRSRSGRHFTCLFWTSQMVEDLMTRETGHGVQQDPCPGRVCRNCRSDPPCYERRNFIDTWYRTRGTSTFHDLLRSAPLYTLRDVLSPS